MTLRGLFIVGTDTGVGKTFVATAIVEGWRALGLRTGAYKPAASGSEPGPDGPVWGDVEQLFLSLNGEFPRERICPQRFHAPLAPPIAAQKEGRHVDAAQLRDGLRWWKERVDYLVVEGAGGLLSPFTESESNADLARDLGFPLVIVARLSLGTINHTLLTIEAAETRNLPIAGIVLNESTYSHEGDPSPQTNPTELARRTKVPILGVIPHLRQQGLPRVPALQRIDFAGLAAGRD